MVDWTEHSCGWWNDGGLNVVIGATFCFELLKGAKYVIYTPMRFLGKFR